MAAAEDLPLRAELFSAEQMESHGRALAGRHRLAARPSPDHLLARLADNEDELVAVCGLLTDALAAKGRITPAGEWLLDNFHLIEEQIRTAKRHLPPGYSRELPRLSEGPAPGRPRVYDLALQAVAHGDGRVDIAGLSRFIAAYQTVTPLALGELWAIPIMLRLAAIENLRRIGARVAAAWGDRRLAKFWADAMTETAASDPKSLILVMADLARSSPLMTSSFVAELARRLQGRGPALAMSMTWIEQRLGELNLTIEQLVQSENQAQAANQVSVSNSIGSLRSLGAVDWRAFVESMSVVDRALSGDPSGDYPMMDFQTRDQYRHVAERLARRSRRTEVEVAQLAVALAGAAATSSRPRPGSEHVGFYLIGPGLVDLEAAAGIRRTLGEALRRPAAGAPLLLYLGSIGALTLLLLAPLVSRAVADGSPRALLPLFALASALAASSLAVALVNWMATLLAHPRPLPRMDFSTGIPEGARTLVVIPTLLSSARGLDALAEGLEVRFLANRDERLHFGLLTDFQDAREETMAGDEALETHARRVIAGLNEKYRAQRAGRSDAFYLFHRPRRWNKAEKVWMGYERKRGKLEDLNHLLRAAPDQSPTDFSSVVGDRAVLSEVKYVITLDTDTELPRDAARECVGAMAHPLNRPFYDEARQRVVLGYGILQPRVVIGLPSARRSRYARMCGGEPGLDPYTRTVSDVYQDLFAEGSFIGKGIYDVDAFERALGGRFPENRILSHDLIEGCFARSGLLSDVQVVEDCPARYGADARRRHRWIRGDWQIAGWLLRRNPLSRLSQWKLLDNLRRSLVPPSLTAVLGLGWIFGSPSWFWTLAIIGILVLPALLASVADLIRKPREVPPGPHLRATARSLVRRLFQVSFDFACLPYEAYFSLDAIARTLWRMGVSRTRLLEWNPSSQEGRGSGRSSRGDLLASYRQMGPAVALAALVTGILAGQSAAKVLMASPVLLLWFASPLFAWWMSLPLRRRPAILTGEQRGFLGMVSRRTWHFFETMVGATDHGLPPDNYQESREPSVAHRTSPTNMGLSLLAHLAAYDFGYLLIPELLDRVERSLSTMSGLERHRGHFLNWYDTETLEPLTPRYVSSVDSGNLAAHLLVLRSGLTALGGDPIVPPRLFAGLRDTLHLLTEGPGEAISPSAEALGAELDRVSTDGALSLASAHSILVRLVQISTALETEFAHRNPAESATPPSPENEGGAVWAASLGRQCRGALADLLFLAPWLLGMSKDARPAAIPELGPNPSLRDLAGLSEKLSATNHQPAGEAAFAGGAARPGLQGLIQQGSERAAERLAILERLAVRSEELARMDFGFLYDKARRTFTVGYHVVERRRDESFYDLLASEARLCTFVAIARGQVPQESWFALGRLLTSASGEAVLLSWSGSMFEYLMPLLVMPEYEGTLLEQTGRAAVRGQIEYGRERGVAWGISESAYNTVDANLNYQYRAFGVPGLGLKRGLADDLVIAPYASALALMVSPDEACSNLQRLAREGTLGTFGFYEAVDHTKARRHRDGSGAVVKTFMAHHQGMTLLALAYHLLDRPMQKRFEADREFQATLLLLQERIPAAALSPLTAQLAEVRTRGAGSETPIRTFAEPATEAPEVQLLSNGRYHVMVTNAGGGSSRFKDLAVTRWREDGVRDPWGTFCYLRELESGSFWSATYQPTGARAKPESYEAVFPEGRAEFRRVDATRGGGSFETHTEIVVSPEDDIELRRVRITNRSKQARRIEVTTYAEVVIAPPSADAMHPAFSNLFVETEILPLRRAILCTRRPRSTTETAPWMVHLMKVLGPGSAEVSFETDRSRFLGRGGSVAAPVALTGRAPLSGTAGSVLDPIVCIRSVIALDPGQTATVDIVTGMAASREQAVGLAERYQDRHLADRVFELGWTHSQVVRRQLNASEADAQLYARLAGSVIHASAALRADPRILRRNRRGQSALWAYAISGDLPIVLLRVAETTSLELVRQLVQAHAYWRLKGLSVDLVIWNEHQAGYLQQLQDQIMGLITSGIGAGVIDRPGGIFVRPASQLSDEDGVLLQSVARVIISDRLGTLAEQLDRKRTPDPRPSAFKVTRPREPEPSSPPSPPNVILDNGLGGFTPDGREYVITLAPGDVTPAPWVNVLANPQFGTVVSEAGSAYTFHENAHEFRLSPWPNDPVSDPSGEVIYLRDEETGTVWSPTPRPAPAHQAYRIRHGFGYSVFELAAEGIRSELWIYVDVEAAIKFSVLKLRNESGRRRKLSATGYVEWVLGDLREKSAMHVTTQIDPLSGALFAHTPFNPEFSDRVAFFDAEDADSNLTGDRREFIGRNGSLRNPAAMSRSRLSGRVGAALDPCAALQVNVDLFAGQEREIVFRLGVGRGVAEASQLVRRFRGGAARTALQGVWNFWKDTLGAVHVETPDPALNVLANGWLLYQAISCRMWARSGFYQSGGAFGFRDQLQDAMALIHTRPSVLREQTLLCASRQFREGDVQHWWHPPSGRGVRTRCSDDYLWLPLAVSRYVLGTGDTGVLDEEARFLEGRPVNPEDDSYYDLPGRSADKASVYEHCVKAIRHGLRFGSHGLPLMGSGDWNDGMNLVGIRGQGESVWLAFFLCEVLGQFARVARGRGDGLFAALCEEERVRLGARIEEHAWDGEWYRRAYFDDGTPLGSAENVEGRIDSISQSWSVLSGAGEPTRSRQAMESVSQRLVRREDGLVQLLDPPFDKSEQDPGYIRGYVPGVRENGGQYTHAAIWATMAFAALGDRERAWELMRMINPANHGGSPERMATYKVEPYVAAADVYAVAPHIGRGGWTWYTGSAGWMYRLILESLLGLTLEGNKLHIAPCIPADWPSYTVRYRYRETLHHIVISQAGPDEGEVDDWMSVTMDGAPQEGRFILLADDQREHTVAVRFRYRDRPPAPRLV